jgi:hypothetical protein
VTTVAVWFVFFGVAILLGLGADDGTKTSDVFIHDVPWNVWLLVAAGAIVIFVLLFLHAVRMVLDLERWGVRVSVVRRRGYVGIAAGAVVIAMAVQLKAGYSPDLPVAHLGARTRAVLWAGLVTSIPWLTLVWLAHDEARRIGSDEDDEGPEATLTRLLKLWRLLVSCVGAFALGVVAAIATSGALRAAFISVHPDCNDKYPDPNSPPSGVVCGETFPAANVLYYGAFFAVLLTIIAAPLVASWRERAQELVERTYPLPADGMPDDTWVADRARLSKILQLDVPILRNPLIALSIFTPLITSTLAAFIPQLG